MPAPESTPRPQPRISYIVVHFGPAEYTHTCLRQLRTHACGLPAEIVVVDNGAETPFHSDDADIIVRFESNRGYGAACNAGARAASGALLFILNNDIELSDNIAAPLAALFDEDAALGIAAPRLSFPDGRFQLSYGEDPGLVSEFRERRRQRESRAGGGPHFERRRAEADHAHDVDWVTGAAFMISRACFNATGGFDEEYFFYFEDADLCRRARLAGYRVRYEPRASIVHLGGGSQSAGDPRIRRWYRLGQVRYYSLHNSRISFWLLKLYFFATLIVAVPPGSDQRTAKRALFQELRAVPYSPLSRRARR
ncbi:MAG: glycosyltransferase [Ignavibacteriae bacterium]|nr:glycosyltransferase [Ignavibacteriota bacterium]